MSLGAKTEISRGYAFGLPHMLGHDSGCSTGSLATPIVFIVDNDVAVDDSLELLIQCQGWKAETFASAEEFLNRPRALVPNCLVLDVSIPGFDGIELQRRIAVERTGTPIICMTNQGDVPTIVQAI